MLAKKEGKKMFNSKKNKHSSTKRMLVGESVNSDKHSSSLTFSLSQTKEACNRHLEAVAVQVIREEQ